MFKISLKGLEKILRDLSRKEKKDIEELKDLLGSYTVRRAVERIANGEVKPETTEFTKKLRIKSGGKTLADTGRLMNSITYVERGNKVIVGSNVVYASIHQFGGTIKPKKAKYLTVPLTKEARRHSQALGTRKYLERLKSQGWNVLIPKGRKVILAKKEGKIKALFALKEEVKIPKRTYVYWDEEDEKRIREIVREWFS